MINEIEQLVIQNGIECLTSRGFKKYFSVYNQKLVSIFEKYLQKKFILPLCNGTVALELILNSLHIKKDNEVIIQQYDYFSNYAIVNKYATPNICSPNACNLAVSIDDVILKINKKTKAIVLSYVGSSIPDIFKLKELAKKNNIILIEDCCQSIGSKYNNKPLGTFGDISFFSFGGSKLFSSGQGAVIATDNENMFKYLYKRINRGRDYLTTEIDYDLSSNYQLSEINASLIIPYIENIEKIANYVNKTHEFIDDLFGKESDYIPKNKENNIRCFMNYSILLPYDDNLKQEILKDTLLEKYLYIGHTHPKKHVLALNKKLLFSKETVIINVIQNIKKRIPKS